MERLGEALRRLRGATAQAELARKSGVSASAINRAEMGHHSPSAETLGALLTALGLTLHDLADALDEVAGRGRPARVGKPDARLVAQLVARGGLSGDFLEGLAATATAPGADADFIATVQAAAAALAEQALERAKSGAREARRGDHAPAIDAPPEEPQDGSRRPRP